MFVRFGIVQSVPSNEEAKKKARLARFGAVPKTDPLEEDKKKVRAVRSASLQHLCGFNACFFCFDDKYDMFQQCVSRFSQPPSGSLSQVNGEGNNIEMVSYCKLVLVEIIDVGVN